MVDAGNRRACAARRRSRARPRRSRARSPRADAASEPQLDAGCARACGGSSAASRRTPPCPGCARARLNWPPISARRLEQRDRVAALGERRRAGEPGRARADDGDALLRCAAGCDRELGLVAGARIDQAARRACCSKMWSRQAWLQAMQVLISSARSCAPPCRRTPGRRGTAAPSTPCRRRRRARISSATSGVLMRLVATSGMRTSRLEPPRHPGERRARHHGDDRRHARLVPADAGVDDRRAGRLDRLARARRPRPSVLPPSTRSSIDRR